MAAKKPQPQRGESPRRLITLQRASEEWGPPYTSLRDLVLSGQLPAVRLGRRIWVRPADLERLIANSRADVG